MNPGAEAAPSQWVARSVPYQRIYISMCKTSLSLLRAMGDMMVTDSVVLQWTLQAGDIVALQQFRDNLMVAAKGTTAKNAMYTVRQTMQSIWGLHVLCPHRDKHPDLVCHGACMGSTVRCMEVSIDVSPSRTLTHAHPNALNAAWQLKFGAPLQSYWATTTRHTTNVFLSALSNVLTSNVFFIPRVLGKMAASPLPSRGSPPLQSGVKNQKWPTSGQSGYMTPAVSGIPTAAKRGGKSEVAHKWAKWLHHPCRLGDPHRCRAGGGGGESEVAHLWAKWRRHPCRLGDPHRFRAGGKIRSGP